MSFDRGFIKMGLRDAPTFVSPSETQSWRTHSFPRDSQTGLIGEVVSIFIKYLHLGLRNKGFSLV